MDGVPENQAEFERLYLRYRRLVYTAAFAIVNEHGSAEDVVQTVFFKVWRRPAAFHGGNIESWLTTVAKHAALDVIRKGRWHTRMTVTDREMYKRAELPNAEDAMISGVLYSSVLQALARLQPERRDVVADAFVGDRTHEAIATERALPLGTVKTRIRSGLSDLRRIFAEA